MLNVLVLFIAATYADNLASLPTVAAKFNVWKETYAKEYPPGEEAAAFKAFAANDAAITAHNIKQLSWTMGHTLFSDLTSEEFQKRYSLSPLPESTSTSVFPLLNKTVQVDSLDWTARGAVTPVKNQGR
jgi:cathepsin L